MWTTARNRYFSLAGVLPERWFGFRPLPLAERGAFAGSLRSPGLAIGDGGSHIPAEGFPGSQRQGGGQYPVGPSRQGVGVERGASRRPGRSPGPQRRAGDHQPAGPASCQGVSVPPPPSQASGSAGQVNYPVLVNA